MGDVPADLHGARGRLRLLLAGFVVGSTVLLALVTGVATGAFGDLGLPTDAEGRPRGLLAIGAAAVLLAVGASIAYRRLVSWTDELTRAVRLVEEARYDDVDVDLRGPRELRQLATTFNDMATRLAADEEQRRRFLADVTHELRNPLAVLQGEIEAQLDGVHPRDDRHLESLLEETRRLGSLVDDLHTLALAESGRLVLRRHAVRLTRLVDDVVALHDGPARARGVALSRRVEDGLPDVWADPARVRQVVDNLVMNATRHTPPGGDVTITVTADPGGRGVTCRVCDAGPGFSEDDLASAFDRFARGGDSGGSGLGLAIARDLVELHGGSIVVANRFADGGASVSFTLPTIGDGESPGPVVSGDLGSPRSG